MSRICVEEAFAGCVKSLGGIVLDETLHQPQFLNADYWFPAHNVIAELKCLTEDYWSRESFSRSLSMLYESWVKKGLVPQLKAKRAVVNIQDFPLQCARQVTEPLKRKLEASTVKKANLQIRETREYLKAKDAKGLLLLVNDGNYALPPSMVRHLLARILNNQHRCIHSVIHFSVNEPVRIPGISRETMFWAQWGFRDRAPVQKEFLVQLRDEWFAHLSLITDDYVYELAPGQLGDVIDEMRFVGRPKL